MAQHWRVRAQAPRREARARQLAWSAHVVEVAIAAHQRYYDSTGLGVLAAP